VPRRQSEELPLQPLGLLQQVDCFAPHPSVHGWYCLEDSFMCDLYWGHEAADAMARQRRMTVAARRDGRRSAGASADPVADQ
jgi:hypothetical protein